MKRSSAEAIAACLSAQESFDELQREALRRFGPRLCDLGYANVYTQPSAVVVGAIRRALEGGRTLSLQYTPYGGATITRRLVAERLCASHGERFDWRDVILTPGAMAALNIVFRSLTLDDADAGSAPGEVIVVTPCWFDYPLYLANLGLRPRFVPLDDSTHRLDLDRIREALGPGTRAVVLSQPANPTGLLYTRDELRGLAEVLSGHARRPLLISDECHRDIVYEDGELCSPVELYDETCVVYSFGKSLAMQGQRIGYVAVSPRMHARCALREQLERLCRIMGFCTPTALMQLAIRDLVDWRPDLSRLSAWRERYITELRQGGYDLHPSQATYFLYPRIIGRDDSSFVQMLAANGVLVLPSALFHHAGHFRISLTATDEMLEAALPILKRVASATALT